MNRLSLRPVALGCVAACAVVAAVSVYPSARRIATDDRNRDGRPDVWRQVADGREPVEVDIDSNFDGRPDIQEYYEHGALVRRESDRNFDDQVDLVEEFDTATQQHVRSVVDVDYDGRADLLVLFRDGRPVFSRYEPPVARLAPATDVVGSVHAVPARQRRLAPLTDPFRTETSVHAARIAQPRGERDALSTVGALPRPPVEATAPIVLARVAVSGDPVPSLPGRFISSPRAPPLS